MTPLGQENLPYKNSKAQALFKQGALQASAPSSAAKTKHANKFFV